MKTTTTLLTVLALGLAPAFAATFDFKDPKAVNHAQFTLDAPLETIVGIANGVTGTVTVDPANLAGATGKIVVAASSAKVPNAMMNDHMLSERWLDVKQFPEISFELKSVANVKQSGDTATADATGTFTLRGVSKEITVPVKVTYLPGRLKDRQPGAEGDLLVIRAEFTFNRSEFGIMPGQGADKVAEEVKITLAMAGAAPKS